MQAPRKPPVRGPSISRVCVALHRAYGSPRLNNRCNPLDELLFVLISQKSGSWSYEEAYLALRRAFRSWSALREVRTEDVAALLKPAGLSNNKAARIKAIADRLDQDFGRVTLAPLKTMSDADAEDYLTSLPGVGEKTAKCVLMYSLDRQVLPVDTHVRRVSTRLGLLERGASDGRAHRRLAAAVPPPLRYGFHVNAVSHGRAVCFKRTPACRACVIGRWCPQPRQA